MIRVDTNAMGVLLTDEQLEQAVALHKNSGQHLEEVLVNLGLCASD